MRFRAFRRFTISFLLLSAVATAHADTRWTSFIPFRKSVEADTSSRYELTEEHGPWLILAASFAGQGAEKQAHELVLELRREFNLPAYVNYKEFDFTEPIEGKTIDRYTGDWAKMKYANYSKFDAYAVLVGDFATSDDPDMQKTLEKIKYMRPSCLDSRRPRSCTGPSCWCSTIWLRRSTSTPRSCCGNG